MKTTTPVQIEVGHKSYTDLLVMVSSSLTQPNPNLPHYKNGNFHLCGKELQISCSNPDGSGQFWYAQYGKDATIEQINLNSLYGDCLPIHFYKSAKSFRGIYNFIKELQKQEEIRSTLLNR